MHELNEDNIIDYLRSGGHISSSARAKARLLEWGVSNVVVRVDVEGADDQVVKQSRERLRTEVHWVSGLDRIWREVDVLKALNRILPAGVVPRVLWEDRDNYVFAMEAIRADHRVWKADLLAGEANESIASQLGELLGQIHTSTVSNDPMTSEWADATNFEELRVTPFYRYMADRITDIEAPLRRLIDEMESNRQCLTLADFSPKNILLTDERITLVDFETAHCGDPGFDIGFFLSHLALKTILHANTREPYLRLMHSFWRHYADTIAGSVLDQPSLEIRSIQHFAACMRSRVDGTSTIDYLTDPSQIELVRRFTNGIMLDPPASIPSVFEQLNDELDSNT